MGRLSWQATALLCVLIVAGAALWSVERSRPKYRFEKVKRGPVDLVYRIDLETNETVLVKPGDDRPLIDRVARPVTEWDEFVDRSQVAAIWMRDNLGESAAGIGVLVIVSSLISFIARFFTKPKGDT